MRPVQSYVVLLRLELSLGTSQSRGRFYLLSNSPWISPSWTRLEPVLELSSSTIPFSKETHRSLFCCTKNCQILQVLDAALLSHTDAPYSHFGRRNILLILIHPLPITDFPRICHWTSSIPFIIAVTSLWTSYCSFYNEQARANNALTEK